MRILKWLFGTVVVLGLVFIAGGFLLPQTVTVARSVEINKPASDIFPYVNSLKATQDWSPWLERDPDVKLEYDGPDVGVGAKMAWASENRNVGNGSQEILVSDPDKLVETALDFGEMGTAKARFILEGAGDVTKVTWNLEADMGTNPVGRWMGLTLDRLVGGDYEKGLANLKSLVEG